MNKTQARKMDAKTIALGAVLTALVVVLQLITQFLNISGASLTFTLVPVVMGVALVGVGMGVWLGLVFAIVVLLEPATGMFYGLSFWGTIFTVLTKGVLCGTIAGIAYKYLSKHNQYVAVITAAILCPIINTGVFLIGTLLFFNEMFKVMIGIIAINFPIELGLNVILAPVILRLLNIRKKMN